LEELYVVMSGVMCRKP